MAPGGVGGADGSDGPGGPGRRPAEGEPQRPRAPAEKRRARSSGAKGASPARVAKQARRRDWLEAGRSALRPGPEWTLIEGRRPVVEALRPRSVLDAHAETGAHQGVAAVVAPLEPIELDELLAIPLGGSEPPFFLALDGIEDPHNLGALVRSADAAGCHGVVLPRHRSAPLSATAVKSSAGALEHVPVAEVPNLTRALERLHASGLWCVGLDAGAQASLFDLDLTDEPVCVVVGGEGAGLHRLVRETCDLLVRIPMGGQVESLNASVAGALALFEVRRRRARARV